VAPDTPRAITCEELIDCARASAWQSAQPSIEHASVYGTPSRKPGDMRAAGGWVVVFDLTNGEQQATNASLVEQCLNLVRPRVSPRRP